MKTTQKYPRRCANKRCRGIVVSKACKNTLCPKCVMRRWNERHPLQRAFHNLRTHARERGKEFTLTIEQFVKFAEKTDYMKRKGKTSLSLSVDRIENALGYLDWNIQGLTLAQNSRKQWVSFFNGGVMPQIDRQEYLRLEKEYAEPLKAIAHKVGTKLGFGTKAFWAEFNQMKLELYQE